MDYLTGSDPAAKGRFKQIIPLGHAGEPEDIAEAVIYFCTDKAKFVTGQILSVDGGMTVS